MSEDEKPVLNPIVLPSGVKRYTAEDIAKMNTALEATGGDIKSAAELLGVDTQFVKDQIKNRPEMFAKWRTTNDSVEGRVNADTIEGQVARATPKEVVLTDAQRRAVVMAVQEKKMKKSLSAIGFKGEEIENICSVEKFAGEHFKQTLSILHGGLVKISIRLAMQIQKIEDRYLVDDTLPEKERMFWYKVYFELIEKVRLMNGEANKAALTRAMIELKKSDAGFSKPGFSVPQVAIQINGAQNPQISAGKNGQPEPL